MCECKGTTESGFHVLIEQMERPLQIVHYGHSFPRRLYSTCIERKISPTQLIGLEADKLYIYGYGGLHYDYIFDDPARYLGRLVDRHIDILSVDLGSNDLCDKDNSPAIVVDKAKRFLDLLDEWNIRPTVVSFISVLQRKGLQARRNQVELNTYNHRVHKFNQKLGKELNSSFPRVQVWHQTKVNHQRYLVDGCHLTPEGNAKHLAFLKHMYASIGHEIHNGLYNTMAKS